jgi:hypothetical protein
MSIHIIVQFFFKIQVNYPLREDEGDQIFLLNPYMVFLLQEKLSKKMMCIKKK